MAALNHTSSTFTLNSGAKMPAIGLGTWKSPPDQVRTAVSHALQKGYRHIDTALNYQNEVEVGQGIRASGVPRNEIWVTTKLDNPWHHRVREGFDKSLKDLGIEYIDLYLVHFPCSTDPEDPTKHLSDWDFIKTWQEMQKLLNTGKVRNIGVSNFQIRHLEKLLSDPSCKVIPAVNQIELHPGNPSPKLMEYCKSKGIHCTAYSCLGGASDNPLYKEPVLSQIAHATRRSPAQILLMWSLQRGTSIIPKSVTLERIEGNFQLDGWELNEDEMRALDGIRTRFKVVHDSWMPIKVFFGDDE
ncbi:alcohol dehydrogenase [Exophiala aquamarina CBS 119918]|uniref:D-xylose reductase [NAD(P)H] n=1 Tax=Exophiala aquamarina CBS 119918 TaxID=1182545 RepID=A0A072P3N8_9EURO|nr:alcohol dehydrogenase [Exophiala aquamarina CBS 119918]KEF54471.1 alcohol dehydrogenase [Exophiala aquamarina CBS 119918]